MSRQTRVGLESKMIVGVFLNASLERVSKFPKMHFRCLELHFCVDFP